MGFDNVINECLSECASFIATAENEGFDCAEDAIDYLEQLSAYFGGAAEEIGDGEWM